MGNPFKSAFKTIGQGLGLVAPDTESVNTAPAMANVQEAANNVKSAQQLQDEGTALAATQGNNAAVQAADATRNAVANSGGGKLARALMSAQAANDAGTTTYNQSLANNINTAARQNQAETDILNQKAGISANAAAQNAQIQNAANQAKYNNNFLGDLTKAAAGTIGQSVASKLFGK